MSSFIRNLSLDSPAKRLLFGAKLVLVCFLLLGACAITAQDIFDQTGMLFPFERTISVVSGSSFFVGGQSDVANFITDKEGRRYRLASRMPRSRPSAKDMDLSDWPPVRGDDLLPRIRIKGYWELGSYFVPNRVAVIVAWPWHELPVAEPTVTDKILDQIIFSYRSGLNPIRKAQLEARLEMESADVSRGVLLSAFHVRDAEYEQQQAVAELIRHLRLWAGLREFPKRSKRIVGLCVESLRRSPPTKVWHWNRDKAVETLESFLFPAPVQPEPFDNQPLPRMTVEDAKQLMGQMAAKATARSNRTWGFLDEE